MKVSYIALLVAGVTAAPAAPSAKFAIQITVPKIGSYYLAKGGKGLGTTNLADAAYCAVDAKTNLVCDGTTIVGTAFANDMVPLMTNPKQTITTGFSVGADKKLHWVNPGFRLQAEIKANQGGEAGWALYPKNGGKVQLYAQLGCPNEPTPTHQNAEHAFHSGMVVGTQKLFFK